MISFLSSVWICFLADKIDDFICNEYFQLNISNKVTGESCMSRTASGYFHSFNSLLIWISSCCQLLACTGFTFFLEGCFFLVSWYLFVLFCRSSFHFLILLYDDVSGSDAVWFSTEVLSFDSCPTDNLPPFPTSLSSKTSGAKKLVSTQVINTYSSSSTDSISLMFPFASTGGWERILEQSWKIRILVSHSAFEKWKVMVTCIFILQSWCTKPDAMQTSPFNLIFYKCNTKDHV